MRSSSDLAAAARNNATWCAAMARAHGTAGTFIDGAWINRGPAPRFHPNLVTLNGPEDSAAHLRAIRDMMVKPPARGWAAKDSFASLDLTALGFRLLFEARWIHRPAQPFDAFPGHCHARQVDSAAMLETWESAWRRGAADPPDRLFPPMLLAEQDHAVIAAIRDGAIVAGCIASRSDGVIGISNLFAPADDADRGRAACLAAAMRCAPGLPLVGYESGGGLAGMTALGFAEIGPLRVWQAPG